MIWRTATIIALLTVSANAFAQEPEPKYDAGKQLLTRAGLITEIANVRGTVRPMVKLTNQPKIENLGCPGATDTWFIGQETNGDTLMTLLVTAFLAKRRVRLGLIKDCGFVNRRIFEQVYIIPQ